MEPILRGMFLMRQGEGRLEGLSAEASAKEGARTGRHASFSSLDSQEYFLRRGKAARKSLADGPEKRQAEFLPPVIPAKAGIQLGGL